MEIIHPIPPKTRRGLEVRLSIVLSVLYDFQFSPVLSLFTLTLIFLFYFFHIFSFYFQANKTL